MECDLTTPLEELKNIVRANTSPGMVDAHAFRLVGEPQDVIDRETRELFEALRLQLPPVPHGVAFGLALALRELVCDRIREIEGGAS